MVQGERRNVYNLEVRYCTVDANSDESFVGLADSEWRGSINVGEATSRYEMHVAFFTCTIEALLLTTWTCHHTCISLDTFYIG